MSDNPLFKSPEDFSEQVLRELDTIGVPVAEAHDFDFYLYLETEAQARECVAALESKGFAVEVQQSSLQRDRPWLCFASLRFAPTTARLSEIGAQFLNLATAHRGLFDGWEVQGGQPPAAKPETDGAGGDPEPR